MDRTEFGEILEGIKIMEGMPFEQMQKVLSPLRMAINKMFPARLYRYRSCNENNMAAFEKDQVWLSTSDMFNDPFDTLIQYDEAQLLSAFDFMSDSNVFKAISQVYAAGFCPYPVDQLVDKDVSEWLKLKAAEVANGNTVALPDSEVIQQMKGLFGLILMQIPKMAQRYSMVACFSEKVDSVLMWSHYAANHTGFALGYDLRLCRSDKKWEDIGIFPIVYSENRYGASAFLIYQFFKLMNVPAHNPDITSSIKLMLYKSVDWQYEQEWRLIKSGPRGSLEGCSEPIDVKPNSIYYGCRISPKDRQMLHDIAVQKGIEEHSVFIDNAGKSYKMRVSD